MIYLDKLFNIIMLALVLVVIIAASGMAQAQESSSSRALWPQQSIAASQSTTALVMGRPLRAIQSAERALASAQGFDHLVAVHNLCLGFLGVRDAIQATPFCAEALTLASQSRELIDGQSALAVVQANIDHARNIKQTRLATTTP